MELKYIKLKMFIIAVVLLGAINTASAHIQYDFIKLLSNKVGININYYFALLCGIFAIIIAFDRNTWLPFLGENIMPSIFVPLKINNGNTIIKINVTPNTKIVYWSALPNNNDVDNINDINNIIKTKIPNVRTAYGNYSNSGVVMSDADGVAILTFDKGSSYKLPNNKILNPHVHYREIDNKSGIIGAIQTQYL